MVDKKFGAHWCLYLTVLLVVSLSLACNVSSGSNLLLDLFDGSQNEVQHDQNQNMLDEDRTLEEVQNQGETQEGLDQVEDRWVLEDFGGMAFRYDPEVIEDLRATEIPLSQGGPGEIPHPAYLRYLLPLDGGAISVVEVSAYRRASDAADDIFPEVRSLLAIRDTPAMDCIPELPLDALYRQCSHQQFNANVAFVDFRNGKGLRFVTVYGIQDAVAISNEHLVYVFQGITNDQRCYVTASFNLSHEDLEAYAEIPREVYRDMTGIGLANYFSEHAQLLNGKPMGYQPTLERFDQIMQSIEVVNCLDE